MTPGQTCKDDEEDALVADLVHEGGVVRSGHKPLHALTDASLSIELETLDPE